MRRVLAYGIVFAGLVITSPVLAETAANFGGVNGCSVRIGADIDTCASARREGHIRAVEP